MLNWLLSEKFIFSIFLSLLRTRQLAEIFLDLTEGKTNKRASCVEYTVIILLVVYS